MSSRFRPMKAVSSLPFSFSFPGPIPGSLRRCVPPVLGLQPLCGDGQAAYGQEHCGRSARAEWTSFGPGLSCQCHLWENCTLACSQPRSIRNHTDARSFASETGGRNSLLTPGRGIWRCRYQASAVLPEVQNRPVRGADPNSVGASNHHFEQLGFCTGHTNTCRAPPEV